MYGVLHIIEAVHAPVLSRRTYQVHQNWYGVEKETLKLYAINHSNYLCPPANVDDQQRQAAARRRQQQQDSNTQSSSFYLPNHTCSASAAYLGRKLTLTTLFFELPCISLNISFVVFCIWSRKAVPACVLVTLLPLTRKLRCVALASVGMWEAGIVTEFR